MPIANINSNEIDRQQLIKEYAKKGWFREIEFDWITIDGRTGRILLKRYHFDANRIQCSGECNQYMLSFVQLRPTGVFWHCGVCRKTDGFISFEEGRELPQYRREVTVDEAWKILNESGQKPPVGMPKQRGGRKFTIKM